MAITENGVGVSFRPRVASSLMISTPAGQPGGILSRQLFGAGASWFATASGKYRTLRVSVLPRLWTSPTDPTDPGYTYGIHWMLGLALGSEGIAGICQSSFIGANNILRYDGTDGAAEGRTRPAPAQWFPMPGVPELISLQPSEGSDSNYMTLALVLASGLTQTVCAAVDLTLGETWTG